MKQIDVCLTRFFTGQAPRKNKWQAIAQQDHLLYLFHYHHLVLVYDGRSHKVVYEWWEKPADKRGLDSAKEWFQTNEEVAKSWRFDGRVTAHSSNANSTI